MTFTKLQPKQGDRVMHCGHHEANNHHFFCLVTEQGAEIIFTRPDGSLCASRWIALCDACFRLHGEHPESVIRADGVWQGDEPSIKQVIN